MLLADAGEHGPAALVDNLFELHAGPRLLPTTRYCPGRQRPHWGTLLYAYGRPGTYGSDVACHVFTISGNENVLFGHYDASRWLPAAAVNMPINTHDGRCHCWMRPSPSLRGALFTARFSRVRQHKRRYCWVLLETENSVLLPIRSFCIFSK